MELENSIKSLPADFPDAVVVDSSTLDADQVVAKIMEIIKKSIGEKEHTGK